MGAINPLVFVRERFYRRPMNTARSIILLVLLSCGGAPPPAQHSIGDPCDPAKGDTDCTEVYPLATCDARYGRCAAQQPCVNDTMCEGYLCIGADLDSSGYCAQNCGVMEGGRICPAGWVCDARFRCHIRY